MKINKINLKAYGHFSDHELDFTNGGNMHLLYGLNEAGKSTILRAFTDLFYGIPKNTLDDFVHEGKKMLLEAEVENSSGEVLYFKRRKGIKNTLLDSKDQPISDNSLDKFTGGISKESFLNIFGLDNEKLRKGGESLLNQGGDSGNSIFTAASGVNNIKLILDELDNKTKDLFKAGGKNAPLNMAISEYREIEKKKSESFLAPRCWAELERNYNEKKKEIEKIKGKLREIEREKSKLQRIKRILPSVAILREIEKELEELKDVQVIPEDWIETRKTNITEERSLLRQLEELDKKIDGLDKRKNQINIPIELIENESLITELFQRKSEYLKNVEQLPKIKTEIELLFDRIESSLKNLGLSIELIDRIDELRIPILKKTRIKELLRQHPILVNDLVNIQERIGKIEEEIENLKNSSEELGNKVDTNSLELSLRAAQRDGRLETEYNNKLNKKNSLVDEINNEIEKLGLWKGSHKDLAKLKFPLNETMKGFRERFFDVEEKFKKIEENIDTNKNKIDDNNEQIMSLDSYNNIPTEEDLKQVRIKRDLGWDLLLGKWVNDEEDDDKIRNYAGEELLHKVYEMDVKQADSVADEIISESEKSAKKQLLLKEINKCEDEIEQLYDAMTQLNDELSNLQIEWKSIWKEIIESPLSPEEMIEWVNRAEKIVDQIKELRTINTDIEDLEKKIGKHRLKIKSSLKGLNQVVDDTGLEDIMIIAEDILTSLNDRNEKIKEILSAIKEKNQNLTAENKKEETINGKIIEWKDLWREAIKETSLSEQLSCNEAESYIDEVDNILSLNQEITKNKKTSENIEVYINEFKEKAKELVERVDSSLIDLPCTDAISKLMDNLDEVKKNKTIKEGLAEQIDLEKITLSTKKVILESIQNDLNELKSKLNCNDMDEVQNKEVLSEKLLKTMKRKTDIEDNILQNGDGLDLDVLVSECDGVDTDSIESNLNELENQYTEIDDKRSRLEREFGVQEDEYNRKVKGTAQEAIEASEKEQEILSKMRSITEKYFVNRLASALLRKGIEYYREKNQSPIITRASEIFNLLTVGAFSGLKIGYDNNDNPIILGIRHTGEEVEVKGMSDGTMDQLYLSLRIASVEKYRENSEPLPLILDDILIHFDDLRSKNTLKVLATLAEKQQIIFFTHHSTIVDLAKDVISEDMLVVHKLGV